MNLNQEKLPSKEEVPTPEARQEIQVNPQEAAKEEGSSLAIAMNNLQQRFVDSANKQNEMGLDGDEKTMDPLKLKLLEEFKKDRESMMKKLRDNSVFDQFKKGHSPEEYNAFLDGYKKEYKNIMHNPENFK